MDAGCLLFQRLLHHCSGKLRLSSQQIGTNIFQLFSRKSNGVAVDQRCNFSYQNLISSEHYRLSNAKSFAAVDWKGSTKTKWGRLIYTTQMAGQYIVISFCILILKPLRKKTCCIHFWCFKVLSLMLPYRRHGKSMRCGTELVSNIMGMKCSGISESACIDPSLAYLIQSSLLQANQDSTEESKEAVSGSGISCIFILFFFPWMRSIYWSNSKQLKWEKSPHGVSCHVTQRKLI